MVSACVMGVASHDEASICLIKPVAQIRRIIRLISVGSALVICDSSCKLVGPCFDAIISKRFKSMATRRAMRLAGYILMLVAQKPMHSTIAYSDRECNQRVHRSQSGANSSMGKAHELRLSSSYSLDIGRIIFNGGEDGFEACVYSSLELPQGCYLVCHDSKQVKGQGI